MKEAEKGKSGKRRGKHGGQDEEELAEPSHRKVGKRQRGN